MSYLLELLGRFGVEVTGIEVAAPSRGRVVLRAQPTGQVRLFVRDGHTGEQIRRFSFGLWPDASQQVFGLVSEAAAMPGSIVGRNTLVRARKGAAYLVRGVRAGSWRIKVHARGYATTMSQPIEVIPNGSTNADVTLDAGRVLRGRITGADGQAVSDAVLSVEPGTEAGLVAGGPAEVFGQLRPSGSSDSFGAIEIEGLTSNSYDIRAEHPQYQPAASTVDCRSAESCSFAFTLHRRTELNGVAVLQDDSFAQGARITVSGTGHGASSRSVETDAHGRFRFRDVLPGSARVVGHGANGEFGSVIVAIPQDSRVISLVLRRGTTLTGNVQAGNPAIALDKGVQCIGPDGFSAMTTMDDVGRFEIAGVPTGVVSCSFSAAGARGGRRWVKRHDVSAELHDVWEILLESGFLVRGVVRGTENPSLCRVLVASSEGPVIAQATPDSGGGFAIEGLNPGVFMVGVDCRSRFARRMIRVEDRDLEIEVVLAQHELGGTVASASSGLPIAAAIVQATIEGATIRALTDSAGRFALKGLTEGEATIVASRSGFVPERKALRLPGETSDLAFLLNPGKACGIRLLDAHSGMPNRSLKYRLLDAAGFEVAVGEGGVAANGRLELPCITQGSIVIGGAGYGVGHHRVTTEADDATVRLSPGGSIEIAPLRAESRSRRIEFTNGEGLPVFDAVFGSREWITGSEGLRISSLAVGQYLMMIDGVADGPFVVADGQVVRVDIPR